MITVDKEIRDALTNPDTVMNVIVRIHLSDTNIIVLSDSARHPKENLGNTFYPGVIVSVRTPKQSLLPNSEKGEIQFIDEDFTTPSKSIWTQIVTQGPRGFLTQVGIYFKIGDTYSDPFYTYTGRTVQARQQNNVIRLELVDLLQSIDDSFSVTASDSSQRDIDPTDSGLSQIGAPKDRAFGGLGRS